MQCSRPGKRAQNHSVQRRGNWARPDKVTQASRSKTGNDGGEKEQRRLDRTRQGKKLKMGHNWPEGRKESCEDTGEGEWRRMERADKQGKQRERQRQGIMDWRQRQESEDGRGNGRRPGEAENPAKTITVLYTNAQSINSKLEELKVVSRDLDPDIVLITETWCNNTMDNAALAIENYRLETDLRMDRCDTTNGIGGGLLVYSKYDLRILPSDKFHGSKFNQFCTFSVATKSTKLNIVLIYRPPSSGLENLTELSEILRGADENTVFIGDFNLPGIDWEREQAKDARARTFLSTVMEEGLDQLITFPTHVKGNILDLLLTNCSDKILDISEVGQLGKATIAWLNLS
jgi:hypothetical protein